MKIRLLIAGALGGELAAELPFTLTHSKPKEESPTPTHRTQSIPSSYSASQKLKNYNSSTITPTTYTNGNNGHLSSTTNIIKQSQPTIEEDVDLIKFDM